MPIHRGRMPTCDESDNPSSGWSPPESLPAKASRGLIETERAARAVRDAPRPNATSHAGYHTFPSGTGSFEVFWNSWAPDDTMGDPNIDEGWYWWPCFPGCLPDGEPNGPHHTSRTAWLDARREG